MSNAEATPSGIPKWTLPDRLRKARESAGFDQAELAELIGIGRTSISNYEKAVSNPKRPVVLSWALATGVPFEWLAHGATTPGPEGPDDECAPRDSNSEPADCPIVPLRRGFAPSEPDEVAA